MKKSTDLNIWEDIFSTRSWGRYPNEELVTFVGRSLKESPSGNLGRVLEVGCGPGANLWFLGRVSHEIVGVDFSRTALEQAVRLYLEMNEHLVPEVPGLNTMHADITSLEPSPEGFDYVFDVLASTHNTLEKIEEVIDGVHKILAPGGVYWGKFWGSECPGFSNGKELGRYSRDLITEGPCQGVGVTTFVDKTVIEALFSKFDSVKFCKTRVADDERILSETYIVIGKKR